MQSLSVYLSLSLAAAVRPAAGGAGPRRAGAPLARRG